MFIVFKDFENNLIIFYLNQYPCQEPVNKKINKKEEAKHLIRRSNSSGTS